MAQRLHTTLRSTTRFLLRPAINERALHTASTRQRPSVRGAMNPPASAARPSSKGHKSFLERLAMGVSAGVACFSGSVLASEYLNDYVLNVPVPVRMVGEIMLLREVVEATAARVGAPLELGRFWDGRVSHSMAEIRVPFTAPRARGVVSATLTNTNRSDPRESEARWAPLLCFVEVDSGDGGVEMIDLMPLLLSHLEAAELGERGTKDGAKAVTLVESGRSAFAFETV